MTATAELDEILSLTREWRQAGRGVALATVVETWGSAPRVAGSMLLCDESGNFVGSVSGGCVEVAVIEAAREVIGQNQARLLEFGLNDADVWSSGLACGGRIRVYVQCPPAATIEQMLDLRRRKQPYVLATWLREGRQEILSKDGGSLQAEVSRALRIDRAVALPDGTDEVFLLPVNPRLRLIVVGAVHIAEPLVQIAAMTGYEVTVVDPRAAFAQRARFEGAEILIDWPEAALRDLAPEHRTAVVVLSHNPQIDDQALRGALRTQAFYIGALGSTRTHQRRLERLQEDGFDPAALARVRGPVGLRIGAKSPAEIAVAIVAEMTATLRQAPVG